jgi:precorrin-4 methylase
MDYTGVDVLNDIINDYKYQMEIIDKYNNVLEELIYFMNNREVEYENSLRLFTSSNKITGNVWVIIHTREGINIYSFNLIYNKLI